MKSCIQESCIPVEVPTELYVRLLDHLSRSTMDCHEPTTAVAAILQKYLDDARTSRPIGRNATPASGRPKDSVTLGLPPAPTKSKALKSIPHSNDWCIGCGCPAEDLIV